MVLRRGESLRGTMLVILLENGRNPQVFERILSPSGSYVWQEGGPGNSEELQKFLDRRRNFDPDSWIIELDTASAERFAAEMNAID